jgi:hypothetical protein
LQLSATLPKARRNALDWLGLGVRNFEMGTSATNDSANLEQAADLISGTYALGFMLSMAHRYGCAG